LFDKYFVNQIFFYKREKSKKIKIRKKSTASEGKWKRWKTFSSSFVGRKQKQGDSNRTTAKNLIKQINE
jgi:hypothetical protein